MVMRQKIVVTGANGQLGRELQELAISFPEFEYIFLSREDLPVHDAERVKNFFSGYSPQYLVNCAAYTAVDKAESEKELAFRVNAEAPGVLAKVCKENNCRFIHISTDYVFDGEATSPYKEDSATNPQGVYGASKLEGEKQALRMNPGSIIIRTSWVYSEFGKNFVKTMLKLMSEREELNVVNDQIGSPTYAADLAEAILQIIKNLHTHHSSLITHSGIYHYSNEGIITWFDFAVAIKEIADHHCKINPIPTSQYPTPAKRPHYSVLSTVKISETFGIKMKPWRNSLQKCIDKLSAPSS